MVLLSKLSNKSGEETVRALFMPFISDGRSKPCHSCMNSCHCTSSIFFVLAYTPSCCMYIP
jgi:hypothetical protein